MTNTPFLFSSVQRQTDAEISLRSVEAHAKEQEAELSRRVAELSAQLRQSREEARQAPKNDKKPRTLPISPMCRTPFSPYLTVIFVLQGTGEDRRHIETEGRARGQVTFEHKKWRSLHSLAQKVAQSESTLMGSKRQIACFDSHTPFAPLCHTPSPLDVTGIPVWSRQAQ